MTYFGRGAVISLAMFFLVYVVLSIVVAAGWRAFKETKASSAGFLYGLRLFPMVSAVAGSALFIVPSFLYLEPLRQNEPIDTPAIVLAACGAAVILLGVFRALLAWWKSFRFASSHCLPRLRIECGVPAVEIGAPGPAIFVAGIRRPTLFVSREARTMLDAREMRMAIRHEMAHVRFRDNLKKLALCACPFPLLGNLEKSWARAAELAADDAAAGDESSALDLASALLKIAAGPRFAQMPAVATGLASDSDQALHERIARLLAWRPRTETAARRSHRGPVTLLILAPLIALYLPLLGQVHELTELLVR